MPQSWARTGRGSRRSSNFFPEQFIPCRWMKRAWPSEIERVVLLKKGKIVADGSKSVLLTDDQVSTLFDHPIVLAQANGWHQALPS